jgi:hypothetical protein
MGSVGARQRTADQLFRLSQRYRRPKPGGWRRNRRGSFVSPCLPCASSHDARVLHDYATHGDGCHSGTNRSRENNDLPTIYLMIIDQA